MADSRLGKPCGHLGCFGIFTRFASISSTHDFENYLRCNTCSKVVYTKPDPNEEDNWGRRCLGCYVGTMRIFKPLRDAVPISAELECSVCSQSIKLASKPVDVIRQYDDPAWVPLLTKPGEVKMAEMNVETREGRSCDCSGTYVAFSDKQKAAYLHCNKCNKVVAKQKNPPGFADNYARWCLACSKGRMSDTKWYSGKLVFCCDRCTQMVDLASLPCAYGRQFADPAWIPPLIDMSRAPKTDSDLKTDDTKLTYKGNFGRPCKNCSGRMVVLQTGGSIPTYKCSKCDQRCTTFAAVDIYDDLNNPSVWLPLPLPLPDGKIGPITKLADKTINDALRLHSGDVTVKYDRVTSFLYSLLRDSVPAGVIENAIQTVLQEDASMDISYSNGWLYHYADYTAKRLADPNHGIEVFDPNV